MTDHVHKTRGCDACGDICLQVMLKEISALNMHNMQLDYVNAYVKELNTKTHKWAAKLIEVWLRDMR